MRCPSMGNILSVKELYYTMSTSVSVPSVELGPPTLSPGSECVPPSRNHGEQHSLAGEGVGGPNSDDWSLEKKFSFLPTLYCNSARCNHPVELQSPYL
jgi:hypothetical protein